MDSLSKKNPVFGLCLGLSVNFFLLPLIRLVGLVGLVCVVGCGEKLTSTLSPPKEKVREVAIQTLEGEFVSSEGNPISLPLHTERPLILLFASSFCGACLEEVEEIKDSFSPPHRLPQTLDFYTVLIYEEREEAEFWKDEHEVPWIVGVDPEGKLFHRYCVKEQTPCTLVFHPQKGLLLNQHGKVSVEKLQSLVGPWSN